MLTPLLYIHVGDVEIVYFGLNISIHQLIEMPLWLPNSEWQPILLNTWVNSLFYIKTYRP